MNPFVKASIFRLEENLIRVENCLSRINEEELWFRPNENSNSVGILLLHLNGNIGQYILSCLGAKPDQRVRSAEFEPTIQPDKNALYIKHETTVTNAIDILRKLSEEALSRKYQVQGFEMNGAEIVTHVTEHYSYHTGQIALLVKLQKNQDLGFYKGVDLNKRNDKL